MLAGATVAGQSPRPGRVEFEVASIRPSSPAASTGGVRIDGAQVHYAQFPFREYVARAFRVRLSHVFGPGNPLIAAIEQLGLKLDARKAPVDVLVVDDARRTPVEN